MHRKWIVLTAAAAGAAALALAVGCPYQPPVDSSGRQHQYARLSLLMLSVNRSFGIVAKEGQSAATDPAAAAEVKQHGGYLELLFAQAKARFSMGDEFNSFADDAAAHAGRIAQLANGDAAAKAKLPQAVTDLGDDCSRCHAKYR